jgi:hypothetical protein
MNIEKMCSKGHKDWAFNGKNNIYCAECSRVAARAWYWANKEKRAKYIREYREKNSDKLKEYDKERYKKPERKLASKANKLKYSYGLTLEQYYSMWEAQDNRCAICPKELVEGKAGAHVDHDHKCCPGKTSCGKCIRGILCADCNNLIERAKENEDILMEAVQYIKKWG